MDKKVTLAQLKEVVQEAYDQVKTNTGGKNADYIPYLANVNKDLFGISVCLLNGQTIHVGDTDYRFGIESVSKVHTAILALRQYGAKEILDKIGADATGLPFNSIIAILLENDHPSTPLVKRRCHLRLQYGTTYRRLCQEVGCHRRERDRFMRQRSPAD